MMKEVVLNSRASTILILTACAALLPMNQLVAQDSNTEKIEYASGAKDVILELYQTYEIIDPEPKPRITLFGDGKLIVHYPPFMKRAGTYSLTLTVNEMEELLLYLSSRGIFSFDKQKATKAKSVAKQEITRLARQGLATLTYRSDDTLSTLNINLSSYTPKGTDARTIQNFTKTIKWFGLQSDAKDHSELSSITDLAEAETTLLSYCNHTNLQKVSK